jgi:hypothetical protein
MVSCERNAEEIARRADLLHHTLKKAAAAGNSEAAALIGATVAETLRNLQRHYQEPPET